MAQPGQPTLIEPQDAVSIYDSQPTLTFTIPSDADNDNLYFKVETDTVNTFDSPNLRSYETLNQVTDNSIWEYFDGSNWQEMTVNGVPSSAYGNSARVTLPFPARLFAGQWYWRVSVADAIASQSGTYNQFIWNQSYFSNP